MLTGSATTVDSIAIANINLFTIDVKCFAVCDIGPATSNCEPCPTGCATCTSLSTCQSCSPSYFLRSDSLCYSTCLPGTYGNSSTNTCDSCTIAVCATCTSLSVCQSCQAGYFLRSDNFCYSTCLPGTYGNSSTKVCDSCPTGCSDCPSAFGCAACNTNYFLQPDFLCLTTCPLQFLAHVPTLSCVACPYDCLTCTSSKTCLSCDTVTHKRTLDTATARCVPENGYF
jgi:proprotein convertase subtilisin/kexin type 5